MVRASTRGTVAPRSSGKVVALDRAIIQRALRNRQRYKYVKPRVEREGEGWKIVSPNCSRSVDPHGGEIEIAWLLSTPHGWLLHARDHARGVWVPRAGGELAAMLHLLCEDPNREFWQ